jgi:uncharacterized cupredoxin-like copper-binding protein
MQHKKIVFLFIPLLVFPCFAEEVRSAEPIVISVALSEFEYTPNILSLKTNTAYTLRFKNTGSIDHDFSAPEFFKSVKVPDISVGKVHEGRIILHPGETVDLDVTTKNAGVFPLRCTYLFHELRGMKGEIDIH